MFARYWKFELIRKLVVLLLIGLFSAALLLGYGAWKYDAALKQPLNLTQEQLLDVPAGATPSGTFNRLEAEGVLQIEYGGLRILDRAALRTRHFGDASDSG